MVDWALKVVKIKYKFLLFSATLLFHFPSSGCSLREYKMRFFMIIILISSHIVISSPPML